MGLTFGGRTANCCKDLTDYSAKQKDCYMQEYCDLSNWVAKPAVQMPVVLAIAEERFQEVCIPPTSTAITPDPIERFGVAAGDPIDPPIDLSPFFSSNFPLTFSAEGLPAGVSIDPDTGIISGTINATFEGDVTVTGTSQCGSTSQTFTLRLLLPS